MLQTLVQYKLRQGTNVGANFWYLLLAELVAVQMVSVLQEQRLCDTLVDHRPSTRLAQYRRQLRHTGIRAAGRVGLVGWEGVGWGKVVAERWARAQAGGGAVVRWVGT